MGRIGRANVCRLKSMEDKINCQHWGECGKAGRGSCALGLFGGLPRLTHCLYYCAHRKPLTGTEPVALGFSRPKRAADTPEDSPASSSAVPQQTPQPEPQPPAPQVDREARIAAAKAARDARATADLGCRPCEKKRRETSSRNS